MIHVLQSRLARWTVDLANLRQSPTIGVAAQLVLWMLGTDIPAKIRDAPRLRLSLPSEGLIVHPNTRIGRNSTLFHDLALAPADAWIPEPHRTSTGGTEIGAGAVVVSGTGKKATIGERAFVGASAAVMTDVPAREAWAGDSASQVESR